MKGLTVNNWQKIETYPLPTEDHDYRVSEILVYSPTEGIKLVQCIREDDYCGCDDSVRYYYRYDNDGLRVENITHWMPLPDAPNEKGFSNDE